MAVFTLGTILIPFSADAQCTLLDDHFNSNPTLASSNTDGAWYPDRYPPAGFVADAGRLKISIDAVDGAQNRPPAYSSSFYNTQGRKFNQCGKCVTVAKSDLYIPADWATNFRRSDIWATAFDNTDAISFYGILGFRNVTGSNPQLSYWSGSAWVELGAPSNGYDTWYSLEIRLNGANLEYLIDNSVVGTLDSDGSVYFGEVIMQAYNFNDNTLGASYDPGPDNSYDAFWDNLVTTGIGGKIVTNTNTGLIYCSIQSAINDANTLDGHTLSVSAGTYTESINISKALTINGPNAGTPGTGSRVAEAILLNCSIDINNSGTTVLDGLHILRNDATAGDQLLLDGNGTNTVQNCIVERNGSATGTAIRAFTTTSGGGTKNILNNKITGDASGGLFSGHKSWNNAIYVNAGSATVNITGNTIMNCRTSLNVDDYNANLNISGNTFNNNGTHVSLGGTSPTTGSYTMGANDFINNSASTMFNNSNVAQAFRLNITSSSLNGVSFAALSDAQLFEIEARMAHKEVSASKKGKVIYKTNQQYVNNFTSPFTKIDKIQNSVKYADSGDVINLEDGTYNEKVTIDKSNITLQGVTSTNTLYIIDGTGVTSPTSGILLDNNVTNVTIQDLTVQNFTGGGGNSHAGIYAPANNNYLTIDNVVVQNNVNAAGIYANGPVDNVSVTNSTVANHGPGARGIVIWNGLKTNITMTGNTVTNNNCCGIELQDGDASAVLISNNTIDIAGGDNAIGLVGLNSSTGANTISNNTITGGGRFGIEIKNPAGGVSVTGNNITLNTQNGDVRDRAGIAIMRRGVSGSNVDVPNGVTLTGNTISGYQQSSTSEGFGIVVEGTGHVVTGNTVQNCDVGIIQQQNPSGYPGDADQSNVADQYFGRGNSPATCGNTISGNTFSGNGTDLRHWPAALATGGSVTNTTTTEIFCSVQSAINDAQTLSGHTLAVRQGSFTENVDAVTGGKDITLAPGSSPGCVTITGNLTLGSGDALDMEVNSTTACTGYDQLTVNGVVTLGGATLNLSVGYTMGAGDAITLIVNDGADAVVGQFAQGNFVTVSGVEYYINYAGGTGNDVVLSRLCADVCGGVVNYTGNVTLSTQAQLNAFKNGSGCKYTKITGSLVLDGNGNAATGSDAVGTDPITDLCNLLELTEVTGSVTIRDFSVAGNPTTLADLNNLLTIGNALTIGATATTDGNSQFTDVTLGGLSSVEGAITIRYNSAATAIGLPALSSSTVASVTIQNNDATNLIISIGNGFSVDGVGDVNISNNLGAKQIIIEAVNIGGDLAVSNNDGQDLEIAGGVQTVGLSLTVQNSADLYSVSFGDLVSIGGTIDLTAGSLTINTNDNEVDQIAFGSLQTIDGNLDMNNVVAHATTPTLDFPELVNVDGNIIITRAAGGMVSFPALTTVEGSITFSTNSTTTPVAGMTSLSIPLLNSASVNALTVSDNARLDNVTIGNGFSTITGGDIAMSNNALLTSLVLNAATAGGIVTLSNNDGTALAVSGSLGDVAEGLNIQNCASLKSVSFPSLLRVGGDPDNTPAGSLTINTNGTTVETISLPALTTIDGNMAMANGTGNFSAAKLTFTALSRVDGNVDVSHMAGKGMSANGDVDFPALTTVEGTITFDFNNNEGAFTGMSALNLGALASTSVDAVLIDDNDAMTSVTLGAAGGFSTIDGGDVTVTDNNVLSTMVINATKAGGVTLTNNDGASLAISGALGQVGQVNNEALNISNNDNLASVSFPSLTTIGGAIDAVNGSLTLQTNGTALSSVSMPALTTVDGALSMSNAVAADVSATADINFNALTTVDAAVTFTRAAKTINAPNLTTIAGSLTVSANSGLTTLAGLESLTTIGTTAANESMVVTNNANLAACCVIPCGLTSIDGNVTPPFTGDLTMSGNLATCNSYAAASTACSVSGLTFTVTENSGNAPNDNDICDGATVNLDAGASATLGTLTFDFFIDVDLSGSYNVGDILITSIVDNTSPYTASTTYSGFTDGQKVAVKVSNSGDGCSSTSSTVTIGVNSYPTISGITLTGGAACTGGPLNLDAQVSGGTPAYAYVWSQTGGSGSGTFSPNNTVDPVDFIGSAPGTVTAEVLVTDSKGCSVSDDVTFTVFGATCVGGTFTGSKNLYTQTDVNNFLTVGGCKYTKIVGNLTIDGNGNPDGTLDPITNLCNLNELLEVTGTVIIRDFVDPLNPTDLGDLAKLQKVGDGTGTDNITIGGAAADKNTSFTNISLPALANVGNGTLNISYNPNATSISLPALASVGFDLNINHNENLQTITAGNNLVISRDFLVTTNFITTPSVVSNLTAINADVISVGRNLTFDNDNHNAGATITMNELTTITGAATISDIAKGTLSLPALTTVGGTFSITNNDNTALGNGLTTVTLPVLTSIGNLGAITGDLSITNNNELATINTTGSNFTVGRDLVVTGNSVTTPASSALATVDFHGLTQVGRNATLDNDNRNSGALVDMPHLTNVGTNLSIDQIAHTINLTSGSGLATGGEVSINDNNNLCNLDMSALTTVGTFLTVTDNYDACGSATVNIPNLATVGSYLFVTGNNDMPSLSFPDLTAVNGANGSSMSIDITDNDKMGTLSFLALNSGTTGEFRVSGNALLTSINAQFLPSVGEDLRLEDNNLVTTLNFSQLGSVTGLINIDDEDAVVNLNGFNLLSTVNHLTINGNNAMTTISNLPFLTDIAGNLAITNNPALNNLSGLSGLLTVDGNMSFVNNDATTTLDGSTGFDALDEVTGTFTATGNALLANCCVVPCRVEDPLNPGFTDGGGAITVNTNNGPGVCTTLAEAKTACTPSAGTITGATNVCLNDNIILTANPSGGAMPYTHTWTITGGTGTATITDASVNPAEFIGTGVGTVQVSYVVQSDEGCSSTAATYTFTVDALPTLTVCPSDQSIPTSQGGTGDCFGKITYTHPNVVDLTAACSPATLQISLDGGSNWTTVTPATSALYNLPKGLTTLQYQLLVNAAVVATCSFNVTVTDDEDPTLINPLTDCSSLDQAGINECLTDATAFDATTLYASVKALYEDNCDNDLAVTLMNTTPGGSNSNCAWTFTYVFKIQDDDGNFVNCSVVRSGEDNTAPSLVGCDADQLDDTHECDGPSGNESAADAWNAANIAYLDGCATDACDADVTVTSDYAFANLTDGCGITGTLTVTYTVTDDCGKFSQVTGTFTIEDNTAPTAICNANITVYLDLNGEATIDPEDIDDGSYDGCGDITLVSVTPSAFDCDNTGDNTVTLLVEDECGLQNTCLSTVTVIDDIFPTAICKDIITVEIVGGTASITPEDVDDGSYDNCTFTMSVSPNTFDCSNIGDNTVTLTVTDASNHMTQCLSTVTVTGRPTVYDLSSLTPEVCLGSTGSIELSSSETGMTYQLYEGVTPIGSALAGDGNALTFTVAPGDLPLGLHTYSVIATKTSSTCTATMNGAPTINVVPDPIAPVIAKLPNVAVVCKDSTVTVTVVTPGSGGTGTCQDEYRYSVDGGTNWSAWSTTIPSFAGVIGTNLVESRRNCDGSGCDSDVNSVSWTIIQCTDISGRIIWEHNHTLGVNTTTVALSGAATDSYVTGVSGNYNFHEMASGNFTLTPTKNINLLNGVTMADAQAVSSHVANLVLITNPYKLVAADVNKNNSVNGADASLIQQAINGNPGALAIFNTSWRFVPTSHTLTMPPWGFPETINITGGMDNIPNQDFYGIKLGDVVTVFANPANTPSAPPLVWNVNDRVLKAGEIFDVVFNAMNFNDLLAYQFALKFDETKLNLVSVQSMNALDLTPEDFGLYHVNSGEIRNTWYANQSHTLNNATPVFKYRFKALADGIKLSQILSLDTDIMVAEAFTEDEVKTEIMLEFNEVQSVAALEPGQNGAFLLLQNRPNPATDRTTVGFILPEGADIVFRIFDVGGREISEVSRFCPAGYNEVQIDMGGQNAGLYYYELTTPFGTRSKKMVLTGK